MVAEPARGLAGGEAEHGRADQPFGALGFRVGQADFSQYGLHRIPDRPGGRGDGRPGQQEREDALVEVACAGTSRPQPPGRPGERTHQLLLAVLDAAQHGGRREIARELGNALARRGVYRSSREELTPGGGDLLAALPVALTAAATLARPATWRRFTGGSVGAYSLTPAAWQALTAAGAGQRHVPAASH
jgi:hypothetical protein